MMTRLLLLIPFAAALPSFEQFKRQYAKTYASPQEEAAHRGYYEARVARLEEMNEANGSPIYGVTAVADRKDDAHYKRGRAGYSSKAHNAVEPQPLKPRNGDAPEAVDWRLTPYVVTDVKNQGQCGSCWAFSATETIESAFVLAGGPPVEMSPQQIASCTKNEDECCDGCAGGDTVAAYEYLMASDGLAPEPYWPYQQGLIPSDECLTARCTKSCSTDLTVLKSDFTYIGPYATLSNYSFATPECTAGACSSQNLTELAARVVESPVSICVNAANWDDYTGGVMTEATCGGMAASDIDHCVQLVGYNATGASPYWIVRNSWSTSWGEEGYIYLEFDENTCGLADEATIVGISGQFVQPTL